MAGEDDYCFHEFIIEKWYQSNRGDCEGLKCKKCGYRKREKNLTK